LVPAHHHLIREDLAELSRQLSHQWTSPTSAMQPSSPQKVQSVHRIHSPVGSPSRAVSGSASPAKCAEPAHENSPESKTKVVRGIPFSPLGSKTSPKNWHTASIKSEGSKFPQSPLGPADGFLRVHARSLPSGTLLLYVEIPTRSRCGDTKSP